jgi:thiol:disulfide interchange protein DsbA
MMLLRRTFIVAIAALGLAAALTQAQPRAGHDYTLLSPPQPSEGGGKVEVIEFFSYACGHCYKLDPFLESWAKKLPADVVFKRIPGAGSESWSQLALLYFSLEAMGKLEALHGKAFDAMHKEGTNLADAKIRAQWLARQGVDTAVYQGIEKSFTVQSKLARAKQLMGAYKVDGVPMIIVAGKYITSTGHAGGPERVVPIVDGLIAMARQPSGAVASTSKPSTAPAPASVKK